MSSPYQSRLFSFLNRQSLRLRDRLGETARHLKVATEWGVQMLIYPVYFLVQSGRLLGKKIEKTADYSQLTGSNETDTPDMDTLSVDQPIDDILTLVKPWVIPDTNTLSSSSTPTVEQLSQHIQQQVQVALESRRSNGMITQVAGQLQKVITGENKPKLSLQGVATDIQSQDLVLVADNNQTFNILSSEQQETLQKQIRTALANFYYEKRLYHLVGQHFPSLIPQFTEKDQNVLPPVRWFWRSMRWVQTSDVAIAINLFGESSLAKPPLIQEKIRDNPEFPLGEWGEREISLSKPHETPDLSQLTHLIYSALEYFYGEWQNSALARSPVIQQLPEASEILQKKIEEKVIKPAAIQLKSLKKQIYQQVEEPDPFRLQVILEAAIAHFFPENKPQPSLKPSQFSPKDTWLTSEDIFPKTLEVPSNSSSDLLHASATQQPSLETNLPKTEINTKSQTIVAKVDDNDLIFNTQKTVKAAPLTANHSSTTQVEFTPDWIETEVETVGYVKHPLEYLLKTLDTVILWIEEMIVKLWHKLRKLWIKV